MSNYFFNTFSILFYLITLAGKLQGSHLTDKLASGSGSQCLKPTFSGVSQTKENKVTVTKLIIPESS